MTFNRGLAIGALVVVALSINDGALAMALMSAVAAAILLGAERVQPHDTEI